MKKISLLSFLFLFTGLVSFAQYTITATVCGEANSVRLTGPWWGWGAASGPEATDNGDGTWTFDFSEQPPTENMEYKLVVDGSMEDLVAAGDFSCTPVTDNSTYANRVWEAGSGNVTGITYGTCASSCDGLVISGCTDASALNYNQNATSDNGTCSYGSSLPMNFEGSSYETSAFDGASIEILDNPYKTGINTSNKVVKVVRSAVATWAGTIVVTKPVDFSEDYVLKMKVYSPNANIPVTVKYESAAGDNSGEFIQNTTVANQWEELSFDFGEEQPSDLFSNLVIIFNNGTMGDGSANSTYYFDDIRLSNQTIDTSAPVTETVNVTFQVDMTSETTDAGGVYIAGGDFGNAGHLMTDNGSDIWTVTLPLDAGQTYLYKFRNYTPDNTGNDWNGFEDANSLAAGGCTSGQYNDRFVNVGGSDMTIDLVKYASCDASSAAVSGCLDANATNYNSEATIQARDENGNIICVYASCDDIPEPGCIYATDGVFGAFAEGFGANECTGYGGTPCDGGASSGEGCMNANATNYDASATSQATDQYGNLLCVFTSCDDVPGGEGCIYSDSFGPYAEGFGAAECSSYGGTPCSGNSSGSSGCMDANATNYDASATSQAQDQYGNLLCVYASCDDLPDNGCLYENSYGPYTEGFGAYECESYGGTACNNVSIFEAEKNLTVIYPNPASNFITIPNVEYRSVEVYSVTGQMVQLSNNSSKVISISNLADGIYTLKITDLNGNLSHSKLIKK